MPLKLPKAHSYLSVVLGAATAVAPWQPHFGKCARFFNLNLAAQGSIQAKTSRLVPHLATATGPLFIAIAMLNTVANGAVTL